MCWGSEQWIDRERVRTELSNLIRLCRTNARIASRRLYNGTTMIETEKECILTLVQLYDALGLRPEDAPYRTGVYRTDEEGGKEVEN